MKNILIIFGAPGSGKGTQAEKIAQKFGLAYFGTGELLRKEAELKSEYGKKFQIIWDKGEGGLIPEELLNEFIYGKLKNLDFKKGVIFDGYPRTLKQVEILKKIFKENNITEYYVLNLDVDEDELIKRMSSRKICENCKTIYEKPDEKGILKCIKCNGRLIIRDEDAPEVIKKRLEVYKIETKPLLDLFQKENKVINIDGNPPINEVFQNIIKEIE